MAELHLDAATGLPFIDDDGTGVARRLGLLQSDAKMMAGLPDFKQYHAPIPESEWQEIDMLGQFGPPVLNQGSFGACTGHGACTAFTLAWLAQGEELLKFSPFYIYGKINGGRDQGASISDTITTLQQNGVCLESTVPYGQIYANRFPAKADQEAAGYKLLEAYRTTDPADVATAFQMGYSVNFSLMVGRTFNNLSSEGVAGVDRGPGNHAVCGAGMKRLSKGWAYIVRNSWGAQWGDNGRFLMTEAHIQSQGYFECVVFRAVTPGPNAPKLVA